MKIRYRLMEAANADGGAGGGEQQQQSSEQQNSAEVERRAREMGWQPKEKWRGNPDSWVDAGEFVKRGETFIPFIQHDRRRLQSQLEEVQNKFSTVQQELQATRTQLQEITEFNRQMAADRDARRKSELGAAIRSEEDPVRRAEMETELRTITDRDQQRQQQQNRQQQQPPPNQNQQQPPVQIQPWVQGFLDNNSEFFGNPHKTALFNSVLLQKRREGDKRVGETEGTALMQEVREEVDRMLGGNGRRQAPSRTEDSRPPSGRSGGVNGKKNYFDLPADAQAKCDAQEARFVGKDKVYKTQAEWRAHYVSEYFG